jgi:hypothetical protein
VDAWLAPSQTRHSAVLRSSPAAPGLRSLPPSPLLWTPRSSLARARTAKCGEHWSLHSRRASSKQLNMIQQKCICCCFARPCGNFFKTSPPPPAYPLFMYSWECGFVTSSDELKQKRTTGKVGCRPGGAEVILGIRSPAAVPGSTCPHPGGRVDTAAWAWGEGEAEARTDTHLILVQSGSSWGHLAETEISVF